MPKVYLFKDLLHDDGNGNERVCGRESVIKMTDMARYEYLKKTLHLRDALPNEEITIFPPPPKPIRNNAADEIGTVIADALKKGMVFPQVKENANN